MHSFPSREFGSTHPSYKNKSEFCANNHKNPRVLMALAVKWYTHRLMEESSTHKSNKL